MVPRWSHDPHKREAFHDPMRDRRIDSADQHLGNHTRLNVATGITDRVRR